jgi:H+/Cl- antiporter ClcA
MKLNTLHSKRASPLIAVADFFGVTAVILGGILALSGLLTSRWFVGFQGRDPEQAVEIIHRARRPFPDKSGAEPVKLKS